MPHVTFTIEPGHVLLCLLWVLLLPGLGLVWALSKLQARDVARRRAAYLKSQETDPERKHP
jgi:hypothetical protein